MLLSSTPTAVPSLIPIPAMHPTTGHDWTILVERALLEDLKMNGPRWKFYNANLISETVESPAVVLQGLNRFGFDDAYCYSRVPSCYWIDDQATRQPLADTAFVVYVSWPGCPTVLDWEFRVAHKVNVGYPRSWQQDFARQVWPPIN